MARQRTNGAKQRKAPTGGRPWTTPRQREWLTGLLGLHEEARVSKKRGAIAAFRRQVLDEFIEKFWKDKVMTPEERQDALVTLERRLKEWFANHNRDVVSSRTVKVLNLTGQKKRRLAGQHAFSHLYYESTLKSIIQKRWIESDDYDPAITEVPLPFRNEIVKELWLQATPDVKEEVEAYIQEQLEDDGREDLSKHKGDEDETPEQRARREANLQLQYDIEALPGTLQKMLEQIRKELGFVGVICLAGPVPAKGGALGMCFGCDGRTEGGRSIEQVNPELRAQLQGIVFDFAEKAIPIERRLARALPGTEGSCKGRYLAPLSTPLAPTLPSTQQLSNEEIAHEKALEAVLAKATYQLESREHSPGSVTDDNNDDAMAGNDGAQTTGEDGTHDIEGDKNPGSVQKGAADQQNGDTATKDEEVFKLTKEQEDKLKELDSILEADSSTPWLEQVASYLRTLSMNPAWLDLLVLFVKFEQHVALNPGKPLSATNRPTVLSDWIRNHRQLRKHHKLTPDELELMCNELFAWWAHLQPAARLPKDCDTDWVDCSAFLRDELEDGAWVELYRGSTNGIYGVMICVGWWLEAAGKELDPSFDILVEDISWVLNVFLTLPAPQPEPKKPSSRPNSRRH
ncbi:hypothetical protein EYR40_004557 [Pleurotus pulmonarius]|nr:hypothetical protein EYR40_004557 [Pleurotus pulmonarius]